MRRGGRADKQYRFDISQQCGAGSSREPYPEKEQSVLTTLVNVEYNWMPRIKIRPAGEVHIL